MCSEAIKWAKISQSGVLEQYEIDPWDNELTNIYWIDVNNSLEKYKDLYITSILQEESKNR